MGKWCLHCSSFIFDQIVIKAAGNQDRHKSSDEFDLGPLVSMALLYVFEMRFDLGTLDSGERSLPFGLLVYLNCYNSAFSGETLVCPKLEYMLFQFGIPTANHRFNNQPEKVQRTAARWTGRHWQNTSHVSDMLNELEWQTLAGGPAGTGLLSILP